MITLEHILRLGVFSCFLGHGVLALGGSAKYLELLQSFGISEGIAATTLLIIGCVDILVAILILVKPTKVVAYWAVGWTLLTITAWFIKETSFWDMMRRVNYTITPLALLIYLLHSTKELGVHSEKVSEEENEKFEDNDIIKLHRLESVIAELDLSMIKMKMMELEEGEGWTQDMCDEVEVEYKRFLQLKLLYRSAALVPNRAIDTMWHYHILDTEAYQRDCQAIFGSFMHHYPYYGMQGKEDEVRLVNSFDITGHLYEKTFGISMDRPDYLNSFQRNRGGFEILIG